MNLDKKSIIQIVILLVLVVGGGVAYLSTQEDGIDIVGSITSLIGGDEEASAPATPAAPPKPAEPAIPAQPAKGSVAGSPFEPDSVMFEGGTLAFVQSREPRTAVLVQIVGPKWETPVGKKIKYLPAGAGSPAVTVSRSSSGGEMKPQTQTDKYTLVLEFGQEKGRKLGGKLYLDAPGEPKTMLAGAFEADIVGFRIVDGKPDLSADSTDTLQYLALRELLKDDPDKQVEVIAFRDGRHDSAAASKPGGYIEVEYRIGQGQPEIKRFQFVKDPEWKIRGTLALNQIDDAHPLTAPAAKDPADRQMVYLAARRLEADAKKKAPKGGVYGVSFVSRVSARHKIGAVEASHKTAADAQPVKTAYLFRMKGSAWVLDRVLNANEKLNVDTGKIEKK